MVYVQNMYCICSLIVLPYLQGIVPNSDPKFEVRLYPIDSVLKLDDFGSALDTFPR